MSVVADDATVNSHNADGVRSVPYSSDYRDRRGDRGNRKNTREPAKTV
jgi:hypothetical protein